MTTIHKKHPPDAIVIQVLGKDSFRVTISIKSEYKSIRHDYRIDSPAVVKTIRTAYDVASNQIRSIPHLADYPIWLQHSRNEWIDISTDDELMIALLSM